MNLFNRHFWSRGRWIHWQEPVVRLGRLPGVTVSTFGRVMGLHSAPAGIGSLWCYTSSWKIALKDYTAFTEVNVKLTSLLCEALRQEAGV